jgi:hypothetical protein
VCASKLCGLNYHSQHRVASKEGLGPHAAVHLPHSRVWVWGPFPSSFQEIVLSLLWICGLLTVHTATLSWKSAHEEAKGQGGPLCADESLLEQVGAGLRQPWLSSTCQDPDLWHLLFSVG